MEEEKYVPQTLSLFGCKIMKFCQENPGVIFNAPPDYQPGFVAEIQECSTVGSMYLRRIFFENKPIVDLLDTVRKGDLLLFIVASRKGSLTAITEVQEISNFGDIPQNRKLDIFRTKTFDRSLGAYQNLWAGSIIAATTINGLSRKMCWKDPEGKIFMTKAKKYGVRTRNNQCSAVPSRGFRKMFETAVMKGNLLVGM